MSKKKDRKSLPIEKRREMNAKMLLEYEDLILQENAVKTQIRMQLARKYNLTSERAVEQTLIRERNKKVLTDESNR